MKKLSRSAKKVQQALNAFGLNLNVVELPDSTRTAIEAAQAVACDVAQIVKSLVFRGGTSGQPILILVSGSNRVNEKALALIIDEPLEKADAAFVREQTGFAIGGIPPLGHTTKMTTYIDQDLLKHETIWAAAGTPHAVFQLASKDLARLTDGRIIDVT
ncbi:MAG: YbaK/EbsC family protein [Chloroflexota bacterium]